MPDEVNEEEAKAAAEAAAKAEAEAQQKAVESELGIAAQKAYAAFRKKGLSHAQAMVAARKV